MRIRKCEDQLLNRNEVVVFLALLHQQKFLVEKEGRFYQERNGANFLPIDTYTAALHGLAGFSFAGKNATVGQEAYDIYASCYFFCGIVELDDAFKVLEIVPAQAFSGRGLVGENLLRGFYRLLLALFAMDKCGYLCCQSFLQNPGCGILLMRPNKIVNLIFWKESENLYPFFGIRVC